MVIIEWLFKGKRSKEVVSLSKAKYRRLEIEAFGATIYWSERIENAKFIKFNIINNLIDS